MLSSMSLSRASVALIAGAAAAAAQSWSVTPSNATTYTPDNSSDQIFMTLNNGAFQTPLVPLTDQATWSLTV